MSKDAILAEFDREQAAKREAFNKKARKRWAVSMNKLDAGIWWHGTDRIKTFELTTKEGTDNTWGTMVKHFQKFTKEMRRNGYDFEYAVAPELSPGKGLLHLHGLMACDNKVPQRLISKIWERTHGAKIVFIQSVHSQKHAQEYIVKHTVKEFYKVEGFSGRLLISKGWMPKNWAFTKDLIIQSSRINEKFLGGSTERWAYVNDTYQEWCKGKLVVLQMREDEGAILCKKGQFTFQRPDGTIVSPSKLAEVI